MQPDCSETLKCLKLILSVVAVHYDDDACNIVIMIFKVIVDFLLLSDVKWITFSHV